MKYFVLVVGMSLTACASTQKQPVTPIENKPVMPVTAQKAPPASAKQILTCTKAKETRLLEVTKNENGCALNYTKAGKASAVATSTHGTQHCEKSKDKIRSKLENAGYKCSLV